MGHLGPSRAVLETCWAILAALVTFRGRLGSLGEPQDGVMAAQGPPKVGPTHANKCETEGGGPVEDYRNPARQHLASFHASTCQGAWWRIILEIISINTLGFYLHNSIYLIFVIKFFKCPAQADIIIRNLVCCDIVSYCPRSAEEN